MIDSLEALHQQLAAARNPDGGWGYYDGKASRIEPTCWVELHLRTSGTRPDGRRTASRLEWLAGCQQANGLLADVAQDAPNLAFNGLAALVLGELAERPEVLRGLLTGLERVKGLALENRNELRQDSRLQGWSWIDSTFSWVEPTCWCLLALKRASEASRAAVTAGRIDEAERLLLDRVCLTGGWNYGNSNVLGQELAAHLPTTALGLLALQDRRDHSVVRRSLEYLVQHRLSERSGMALALTSICLRIYDVPAADVDDRLRALAEHHGFLGNLHVIAMALYALSGEAHDAAAFRV